MEHQAGGDGEQGGDFLLKDPNLWWNQQHGAVNPLEDFSPYLGCYL